MPTLTPESLFEYVVTFTQKREQQNASRLHPKISEACRKFHCRISDIQDAINDYQGAHYLGCVVGFQCAGGSSEIVHSGNYLIEAELVCQESSK